MYYRFGAVKSAVGGVRALSHLLLLFTYGGVLYQNRSREDVVSGQLSPVREPAARSRPEQPPAEGRATDGGIAAAERRRSGGGAAAAPRQLEMSSTSGIVREADSIVMLT